MKYMERFYKLDAEGIIEQEIRNELKANWEDYLEDNPSDWNVVLKIWPDFDQPIRITSYKYLVGLASSLDNLASDALKRFINNTSPTSTTIKHSVKKDCLDKNPSLYSSFQDKLAFPILEEDDPTLSPIHQDLVEGKVIYNFTSTFGPEEINHTLDELFEEKAGMSAKLVSRVRQARLTDEHNCVVEIKLRLLMAKNASLASK